MSWDTPLHLQKGQIPQRLTRETILYFLDFGVELNKIYLLLKYEKSHKFKVSRYAVKQKRPRRTVFLQFSKVDFYVWTL